MTEHVGDNDIWAAELRRNTLLFPDDRVVALVRRKFPRVDPLGSLTALDVGFGSGRHMKFLAEVGFRTSGIELIPEATEQASVLLASDPLIDTIATGDILDAPFSQCYFNLVVNWGCIFLGTYDDMCAQIDLMTDLLRPGGSLVVNFRKPESWFSANGESIGSSTVLLDKSAGPYAGGIYTFLTTDQARSVLEDAGLIIGDEEQLERIQGPERRRHSWSMFRADKPL